MMNIRAEIQTFLWRHRWHALAIPLVGGLGYTGLHEAAHALAVMHLGGEVTAFRWWPNGDGLGAVHYRLPMDRADWPVALAPYFGWTLLMGLASLLAWWAKPLSFGAASFVFVWLFALPAGDIGLAALPYALFAEVNDCHQAWGEPTRLIQVLIGLCALGVLAWGDWIQRELYRANALSRPAYLMLACLTMTVVAMG